MPGLPSVVFGIVALGPAVLALLLPDTSKAALPDDLTAAEKLDAVPDEDQAPSERQEASHQVVVTQS